MRFFFKTGHNEQLSISGKQENYERNQRGEMQSPFTFYTSLKATICNISKFRLQDPIALLWNP